MKKSADPERLGAYYEDLGAAVLVCAQLEPFKSFSLRALAVWIAPAVHHGQISFFCDKRGWPTGFVSWAHFSEETEATMIADRAYIPRVCEWNEGSRTHIVTIAARDSLLHAFTRHISEKMFRECGSIHFFSRRGGGDRRRLFSRSVRRGGEG